VFEWVFHWLFNFLWCRSETMDNLFSAQVCFNGGNPHLFKVWADVTLKGHTKGSEGSTEWNQLRPQPQRHKEGGGPSVCTSQLFAVGKDNADRRWLREEHIFHISSALHTPDDWDGSYIAEIAWRYSQEIDSAIRLCLGSIIIM